MHRISNLILWTAVTVSACQLVSGCSGLPKTPAEHRSSGDLRDDLADADLGIEEGKRLTANGEEATGLEEHPEVLANVDERVTKWVVHYTGRGRKTFERYLERGQPYKAAIEKELKSQGVPPEFYYLALIESGFVPNAVSRQKAVGLWQFVRGTGKRYGLRCEHDIDERRDPLRATAAAARYLKDLYNVFGSWRLALAAYNAGEFRILSAVMRGKSRDFWELAEKRQLPKETMNYVPKFLAAAIIGKNPEKYGFELVDDVDDQEWEIVEVPSPIKLASISEKTGVGSDDLLEWNPHLTAGMTPKDKKTYGIWVAKDEAEKVKQVRSQLASHVVPASQLAVASHKDKSVKSYRVQRGDTLIHISRKFGVSVSRLKSINNMDSSRLRRGQVLKLHSPL